MNAQERSPPINFRPVGLECLPRIVYAPPGLQRLHPRRHLNPDGLVSRGIISVSPLKEVLSVLRYSPMSQSGVATRRETRHFPPTTRTFLKLNTPSDQLHGLLSTLFPPNSFSIDGATRITLNQSLGHQRRPALKIGCTYIRYLKEGGEFVVAPAQMTFALPFVEAVHRVGQHIRALTVWLDCGLVMRPEVWRDLLDHLPVLEKLVYRPTQSTDHQWSPFWSLLCRVGGEGLICPSLKTLWIDSMQGIPLDLVPCLSLRCELGRPLDAFRLVVKGCGLSDAQQAIAQLRPLVGQLTFEVIESGRIVSLAS
jgi:hypothetical protein